MKIYIYLVIGLLTLLSQNGQAQFDEPSSFQRNFHPTKIFSVDVSSTMGIGNSGSTFLFFDNQFSLWQRPKQFLMLKTGIGVGFMRNDFGKLASVGSPLALVYCAGKKSHYFEASMGGRFIVGFSMTEGFQVVPFLMPSVGYRYQIPKEVYFHTYVAMQYHPNLGFAPILGIGVGYDY
jgi:hypothetical protein